MNQLQDFLKEQKEMEEEDEENLAHQRYLSNHKLTDRI